MANQGLGESKPLQVSPGAQKYQQLLIGGFTPEEANSWAVQQNQKLQTAGFKPSEIDAYWGNMNPVGSQGGDMLAAHFNQNLADSITHTTDARIGHGPKDAFAAGWNMSVTGLVTNGRPTNVVMPENAGLFDRVMNGVGQFSGDLPATVGGLFGGATVGASVGSAVPVVGTAVGGVVGGGAGAAGAPEAARQILLDAYAAHDGRIRSWQDAVQVVTHSLASTAKQTLIGGVAAPVGGAVGGKLAEAGAAPLIAGGSDAVTQVGVATGMGSAMDGHMPDAKDFEAGAILALGFHVSGGLATLRGNKDFLRAKNNLETIYRQTGTPPWEAATRAQHDPQFRQELFTQDVNGETVAPNFRNVAPDEPQPFKPAPRASSAGEAPGAQAGAFKPASRPAQPAAQRALPPSETIYADNVPHALDLLGNLEHSGDKAISPAGAIGKYQIMPGTARQYMGKDFDVRQLLDPAVNRQVAERVVTDLYRRYQGNMTAISIAYNAGPGRAGEFLKQGTGTRLEAQRDPTMKNGWRYESVPADKNEAFLPKETQEYLARARLFMGGKGDLPKGEETGVHVFPTGEEIPGQEDILGEGGGGGGQPPAVPGELPGEPKGEKPNPWMGKSEETLTEAMMANVGEQPGRPGVLDLDKVMSQFVSELTPARRLDDRLIKGGEMDRTKDLGAEDMFRQTYASDARAGVFVRYGAIDPITLDIKPGSKSVLDATRAVREAGGNLDGWVSYMLAHRTVDKAAQGIETGMSSKVAEAIVNNKKMTAKYEEATRTLNDVFNSVLEYSRDSGVHSQEQVDAMNRDNPTYISMRRVMGDNESFDGKGRGFKTRDSLRRMEGSDRQIVDPIQASLDNIRVIVKMADRNRAIGHVIGMQERGEADLGLVKLEDKATLAEPGDTFKPYGIEASDQTKGTYAPLLAQRAAGKMGPNDFLFIRDGKPELWSAKDPLLAQLMRGADSPGQMNVVTRAFQFAAAVERTGIVVNPDFPTRVQLRHQITAFIADPLHPPPFVTWLRGIGHVLKQDEFFQDATAKGAMGVALADMDVRWLARDMDAVFRETGTYNGVWNAVKHPLEFAQLVSERMDAAARVGYTLHAADQGVEPIKAATMSRKAYLDYAEKGTAQIANWMATIIPFFRPHILGLKQGWEAVANDPLRTLKYGTIGIAVPMAAMYALNYIADQALPDDRKYKNLPQWERDQYFITPEIAGVRLKLKTPPNFGFAMGGMVNRVLDALAEKDPHAFDGWAKQFLGEFIPPVMPTIVQAPTEAITNHSFYTGHALIPGSLEKDSGYMQYTPYSSEVGKALSRALGPPGLNVAGMSPILFDHFVDGWTGTVGHSVLHALDVPMGGGNRKPYQLADIPFVGSFLVRHPEMSADPIQKFYTSMDDLEAKSSDFSLAMRRAEQGDASEIDRTAPSGQYASAIAPIKQALEVQSQVVQGIYANKDLSATEKRQLVDQVMPNLIATAQQGLQAMDDLKQSAARADQDNLLPPPPPAPDVNGPAQGRGNVAAPPVVGENRGEVPVA